MNDPAGWSVTRLRMPAAELHGRALEVPARRAVTVCEVARAALVLGSTQPWSDADTRAAAAAGVDVVRRRSGGGAVLVDPGDVLWVDVVVPADDPLWLVDVGRAFGWLGQVWARAVEALGAPGEVRVHDGALVRSDWSSQVCFAGLGPGEVLLDGHKVVGIAQRRTRAAALFQCAAVLAWRPARLVSLLDLEPSRRAAATAALADVARPLPATGGELLEHFFAALAAG